MRLIRLINSIKNVLRLSPKYFISYEPEEDLEELYARIRKGFYPTAEEIQKYNKYELVMRYWRLRKLAGPGPITSLKRLRRETRSIRRSFRTIVYKKKEYRRRFLKAVIYYDVQTLLSIFGASRKMFRRIIADINYSSSTTYFVVMQLNLG